MKFKYKEYKLHNVKSKKIEKVKGIVLYSSTEHYGLDFHGKVYGMLIEKNNAKENVGYHYSITNDPDDPKVDKKAKEKENLIFKHNENQQIIGSEGDATYISRGLYKEKPQEYVIAINVHIDPNKDYELLEKKLIYYLSELIIKHKLSSKYVWRGFDLFKEDTSPLQYLDKNIFSKFIDKINEVLKDNKYEQPKEEDVIPPDIETPEGDSEGGDNDSETPEEGETPQTYSKDLIEKETKIESPFKDVAKKEKMTVTEYVNKLIKDNKADPKAYANKFQPWDKGLKAARNNDSTVGEIVTTETPVGNDIVYKITENAPLGLDHCEKAVGVLEAVETTQETLVEPIYPDLIVPPGEELYIADGTSAGGIQSDSNTPLSAEEFEKRQKVFDFSQFDNIKKETKGRPVNVEDPFPVDDQIKKLEEHFPKVKIDKTTFTFTDTNHPNSEIGAAMSKNLAMTYDMISEISKRTEKRLVKLENNLATVMRNMFRLSSRININCVYYGGQSVYGKYKCIRCLDDERIHDGAVVTIDQCMNCTRYEPILGQVYAILDETGSNAVQVMDDLQMAYMSINEYNDLNSLTAYPEPPNEANVTNHTDEKPKPFLEDKWKDSKKEREKKEENDPQGFKMDWTVSRLELQSPNVNEYKIEGIKPEKNHVTSDIQGDDPTIFEDTRQDAVEYEQLEFDIKDYEFGSFGKGSGDSYVGGSSSDGSFGLGATEARNKIVEYAKRAVDLCAQGKAKYSQGFRYNHDKNAINGVHYYDCSSLAEAAYKQVGINVGRNTVEQYPNCLTKSGGLLMLPSEIDKALPGDLIFFKKGQKATSRDQLQDKNFARWHESDPKGIGVYHVAIYAGNNQYHQASGSSSVPNIKTSPIGWDKNIFAIGRPKAIIELDQQASQGVSGEGAWSREAHKISDELWNAGNVAISNVNGMIKYMAQYGYKSALIEISKKYGYDPYFIAAIIAIESSGNPMTRGSYPGLMQCDDGFPASDIKGIRANIELGCKTLNHKKDWIKGKGWTEDQPHLLANAHNCGPYGLSDAMGYTIETQRFKRPQPKAPLLGKVHPWTVNIQEASVIIYDYAKAYQKRLWNLEEKRTYGCKVLRAYNILKSKKALD